VADPKYLIDANLCINLLEGRSEIAANRLAECDVGQIVTSAVVYAEVMIGAEQQGKVDQAMAFFTQIPVLSFDEAAGRAYSRVPFKRGRSHRLIAAHALALGLTVVTSNLDDFRDVPDLQVEDWTE
jgi:tRNA(fMet)-specific endonuclease VapC